MSRDVPYNSFQLVGKYLNYYINSVGKHGVHPPFVFDFITKVLNNRRKYAEYKIASTYFNSLLKNRSSITIEDFGAGSRVNTSKSRKICEIAKGSSQSRRNSELFFRIAKHYNCRSVLELGACLGVTSNYLSLVPNVDHVLTVEGSTTLANVTKSYLSKQVGNSKIKVVNALFDDFFDNYTHSDNKYDLCVVDGNHKYSSTLNYFKKLKSLTHQNSIIIFDDIHWSPGMEMAWKEISGDDAVTLSLDFFRFGIVFFNEKLTKQHFLIRY